MSKTAARRYRIVRWNESTRRGWVVVVDPAGDSDVYNVLDYFDSYSEAVAYLTQLAQRQRVLEGKG
jgi:hypothetical protein